MAHWPHHHEAMPVAQEQAFPRNGTVRWTRGIIKNHGSEMKLQTIASQCIIYPCIYISDACFKLALADSFSIWGFSDAVLWGLWRAGSHSQF